MVEVMTLFRDCFSHLTTFCVSKCRVHSWEVILLLMPLLPSVEELFATHSNFIDLPSFSPALDPPAPSVLSGFASLRVLDVSACQIYEWAQLLTLGSLPALKELLADDNPISKVLPCPDGLFATLTRLSLSGIP